MTYQQLNINQKINAKGNSVAWGWERPKSIYRERNNDQWYWHLYKPEGLWNKH